MTLLADPSAETTDDTTRQVPGWVPLAWGAGAAALSLALVMAVVTVTWSADELSTGGAGTALGVGASLWLGIGGARLSLAGAPLGLVPLVFLLVPVAAAAWSAHRVLGLRDEDEDGWVAGLLSRSALRLVGLWWGGYAAVLAVAAGWGATSPLVPVWWTLVLPLVVVPALGLAAALRRLARVDEWLLGPRLDGSMLPLWLRRAVGPAVRGAGALLVVGATLVVAVVALGWDRVLAAHTAIGAGGVGAGVLWLVQAAALPNMSMWALSFLAGPGFSVVDGASTTWSGSRAGLMPLIPVLAALPQPRSFPWFVALAVVVPVIVGGFVGRWSLGMVARLSAVRTKLSVAAVASVLAAALVAVLDVLGGASLGSYRLAEVGAPAGWLALCLAGELLVGAVLVVLHDAWRLRR